MGLERQRDRALAKLLRNEKHEVRSAWRLTEELSDWADVIIRFADAPGPPGAEEADWYDEWLDGRPNRSLIYVVHDYEAQEEYWKHVIDQLASSPEDPRRSLAETNLERARGWVSQLPPREAKASDPQIWFAVGKSADPPRQCKSLAGPWADDINAAEAALMVHEPLKPGDESVLLTGDGDVLAMEWEVDHGGRILAIANGSFLLNFPLAIPARRPLAERVVEWIGKQPRHVAFVEGSMVEEQAEDTPTLFDLIARLKTFRWVAIHLAVFGLLAALARAPRLGRPNPEAPSDADRPAAHAEAVGALLERSRGTAAARELLETYRRWRFPRTPQEAHRSTERGTTNPGSP